MGTPTSVAVAVEAGLPGLAAIWHFVRRAPELGGRVGHECWGISENHDTSRDAIMAVHIR